MLVEIVKIFGDVVVVVLDFLQLGMGYVIIISGLIWFYFNKQVFEDVEVYECFGMLVDCVKLVKYVVLKDWQFDLCFLGINYGFNVFINIIYLGMFLVVMEVLLEGILFIGLFLFDYFYEVDFEFCVFFVKILVEWVLNNGLEEGSFLNVNILVIF